MDSGREVHLQQGKAYATYRIVFDKTGPFIHANRSLLFSTETMMSLIWSTHARPSLYMLG